MTENPAPTLRPLIIADFVEKVRKVRDHLMNGLVERDVAVRLGLLATLAGEHLLLLGPPGTAKSLVARRLHLAFPDTPYFERLLTRFTVPEELFGPLSIKALEEDRYERLTEAYLPKAGIAFLDEIFKTNSAILNALLTLLNEREFDNGTRREGTPLIAVIGASNELPDGEELDALFDRFLLRLHVGPVSKGAFSSLLGLRGHGVPKVPPELTLEADELATLRNAAEHVEVPDDVVALLCDLRDWCTAEGMKVSDRRWRKVVKLLQVAAATNGRALVSVWDCWLLQHCLWDAPDGREKVYAWYAARVGASAAMDPSRLTKVVVALEGQLASDRGSLSQMRDARGRHLFRDANERKRALPKGTVQKHRDGAPLYLAPAHARPQYHHRTTPMDDRSKNGAGYTTAELNALYIDYHGRRIEVRDWPEREAYMSEPANWLTVAADLPPAMEPTRFSTSHIESRLRDVEDLRANVANYQAKLLDHIASLEAGIRDHLWVTPDFVGPASKSLQTTRETVESLLRRIDKLHEGFASLPRELPLPSSDADIADGEAGR